ncbi:ABC transporter ATP-binding protein [Amaricoccus macauensis]|uniref:ABC transporter ATP-binding protein n=1 Tax=Amaricoccus macauensis TaxID=57001 RepID=UPI003C7C947E
MTKPYVSLKNVDRRYPGHHAVKGINLDIEPGEFLAIMGPSGCGKSTTLRMIAGLEQPSSGTIRIGGRDMAEIPASQRDTPMVWQSLALFPFLSVADNVSFPLKMKGVTPKERRRRAEEWLERLGLGGMADRNISQLSGGQRQRVAIARALVTQPALILLDEPLSALDAHLRVRLQAELSRLHRELKITFIYVTHAQSEAFALADRVVIMADGQIQQAGPPQEVYRAPTNPFVAEFIGMNNLIRGSVVGRDGDALILDSQYGRMQVPNGGQAMQMGEDAAFVIAADRVDLGAPDGMPGTVLGLEFLGSTQTIYVEAPDGREFRVQKQQHEVEALRLGPGAQVSLGWNPAHAWLLPQATQEKPNVQ